MERAEAYGAHAVFFEAEKDGRRPAAQAFVFLSDPLSEGSAGAQRFEALHRRLWSWGGVPLVYRQTPGQVQLFRGACEPHFLEPEGTAPCRPVRVLELAATVATDLARDPCWDAEQLRSGALWDDPAVCRELLPPGASAHQSLFAAVEELYQRLQHEQVLSEPLMRKLLILSLLIAYLEARGVLLPSYFSQFLPGATRFFEVLADREALLALLSALEQRFNGKVFALTSEEASGLQDGAALSGFARLVEGREGAGGQRTLWQIYSFRDLPIELISNIYQLFVRDVRSSIYTPPFLVRLMLDEVMSWERLDRLEAERQGVLDPSCGSGVFLVEAYKRLVLHWRSRHEWRKPDVGILRELLTRIHGIDLLPGAVELAAFSLCLALCDALEPEDIRASVRLFPELLMQTLHPCCFFEAKEQGLLQGAIGIVVGNPPFESKLTTEGARRSSARFEAAYGRLPDRQLAYLFLSDAMELLSEGGVLCLLQQYNFLYNQQSQGFRQGFFRRWDVREVLDFVSVRGLFKKGDADTKVVVVLAQAQSPPLDRKLLHATFRRSARTQAQEGFDIDAYDLHWLPRSLVLANDGVWRADLLGGGRVLGFADRLKTLRTLGSYAASQGWDVGEGFVEGESVRRRPAAHITGQPMLPSRALSAEGIKRDAITPATGRLFKTPYTEARYTPPMLLLREHMDLPHALWTDHYLTYPDQIVGFCAPPEALPELQAVDTWLRAEKRALQAYVAATSARLFTRKATAVSAEDLRALPYPESGDLGISRNERIVVDDIVDAYRDLIRFGADARVMEPCGTSDLAAFTSVFLAQINGVYSENPLRVLPPQSFSGARCQPFVFGPGEVDWQGADGLRDKLQALLRHRAGRDLYMTRVVRIYDGSYIFLLKPDRRRYWLRSIALRDADEVLADLREQGL